MEGRGLERKRREKCGGRAGMQGEGRERGRRVVVRYNDTLPVVNVLESRDV
jgi:hypothetical protein